MAGLVIEAIHLIRGFSGAGLGTGILGIASIIFGFFLIANPFIAALTLMTVLAIIGGGLTIVFVLWRPA